MNGWMDGVRACVLVPIDDLAPCLSALLRQAAGSVKACVGQALQIMGRCVI